MVGNFTSIIWDWNGTLLDDVDICIDTINYSLGTRNLPLLTKKRYREIFTFPVIDYYEKTGFNFSQNSFDELSHEFIDLYLKKLNTANLFQDVEYVLQVLAGRGVRQYILSAMEQVSLLDSVRNFNIEDFFTEIRGSSDIYAYGKLQNARQLIANSRLNPDRTCLIGDTLHDLEVANSLGCQCFLVTAGHQSHYRLASNHSRVVKKIKDVLRFC